MSLSQNESEVLVEVKDAGIGISHQEQQTIFQRYHQGNHRRSGKGLGLYLCQQQIIHAHQGKITVHSDAHLGQGTTFTFSIAKS